MGTISTFRGDLLDSLLEKTRNKGERSFLCTVWGSARRAIIGSTAAVLFGMFIFGMSLLAAVEPVKVHPFEGVLAVDSKQMYRVMPTDKPATDSVKTVEYYLPYPGMLPDSPFYKLKTARDRISLWFTVNPEKKAEKELYFADKRINAAMFLMDGGKEVVAVSTATKAEKYLSQSVELAIKLSKDGKDMKSLLGKLDTATLKHKEILEGMTSKATGERKEVLESTKQMTKMLQEKINQALAEAK